MAGGLHHHHHQLGRNTVPLSPAPNGHRRSTKSTPDPRSTFQHLLINFMCVALPRTHTHTHAKKDHPFQTSSYIPKFQSAFACMCKGTITRCLFRLAKRLAESVYANSCSVVTSFKKMFYLAVVFKWNVRQINCFITFLLWFHKHSLNTLSTSYYATAPSPLSHSFAGSAIAPSFYWMLLKDNSTNGNLTWLEWLNK